MPSYGSLRPHDKQTEEIYDPDEGRSAHLDQGHNESNVIHSIAAALYEGVYQIC